ncbi:MAG: STAS domain-containing protein [Magnetococcales bacterium]|nr:STAS domain-containing protein [Magnetococcales bacterium]
MQSILNKFRKKKDTSKISVYEDSGSINLLINTERFDFTTHASFHNAYRGRNSRSKYIIDFSKVKVMDRSALGMLLMLREQNGSNMKHIELVNCSNEILYTLSNAKFDKLFTIKPLV